MVTAPFPCLAATSLAGIMRTTSTPFGSAHVRCTWSSEDSSRKLCGKQTACECAICSCCHSYTRLSLAQAVRVHRNIGIVAASLHQDFPHLCQKASRLSIHSGLRWRSSANTNARSPRRNLLPMASGLGVPCQTNGRLELPGIKAASTLPW